MNTTEMMKIALDLAGLKEETLDAEICYPCEDVHKVVCGIDMDCAALVAAKMKGYDCVAEHHGINTKCVNINTLMAHDQTMRMYEFGVPIAAAQKAITPKAQAVYDSFHARNMANKRDMARFLEMPYMGIHTPADMIGQMTVQGHLDKKLGNDPFAKVQDIIDALYEIDEYKKALQPPVIKVGSKDDYCGKIAVLFAGCTGGGPDVYRAYFDAGVGTLVLMHIDEESEKAIKEQNKGNVVVAGHMASDSIGFNKILDAWEAKGLEITRIGGIVR